MLKRIVLPVSALLLLISSSKLASNAVAADVLTVGDLQVQGIIESTGGGFKFPDGSTLTTAGLSGLLFNVGFVVDNSNSNTGNLLSGAVKFGAGSTGEGIASQRTAGTNQNGIDLFTNNTARISILNNGYIGIGNRSPAFPLTVSLAKSWTHARFGDTMPTYIGSNASWIGSNLYWDASYTWKHGSTGAGGLMFLTNPGIAFATSAATRGGNDATLVWGIKILDGKLRVGDNADPTEKLDVAGNIKASGSLTVAGGGFFSNSTGSALTASSTGGTGIYASTSVLSSAGVIGYNSGGGESVVGTTKSVSLATGAVVGRNDGPGYGVRGFIATDTSGNGIGVFGQVGISSSTGKAARFENLNMSNLSNTLEVETNSYGIIPAPGGGHAGYFKVINGSSVSAAVKGEVNSIYANAGAAGIYGLATGTGGYGGFFSYTNTAGSGSALTATYNGNWNAFSVDHTGAAGSIAAFSSNGLNVARIDKSGKGYFNNGTQNSGADLAEVFAVEGSPSQYEPGDVLEISITSDRTVTKTGNAYSTLVAGVYATRPGILLTEESIDADITTKVPLGVIGVIPTKVCDENGPIRRGDLLVSSSKAGYAMKADLERVKPGQVIGKSLDNFSENGTGKIRVLVNVR